MSYRDDFREGQSNALWSLPRIGLTLILFMVVLFVIAFISSGGDLAMYKFWAPKMENAKREVFENTQSYVQGKTEYLSKLRFEYQNAEPGSAQQLSLRSLIISEAALVDNDKLPADLRSFVNQMKGSL